MTKLTVFLILWAAMALVYFYIMYSDADDHECDDESCTRCFEQEDV